MRVQAPACGGCASPRIRSTAATRAPFCGSCPGSWPGRRGASSLPATSLCRGVPMSVAEPLRRMGAQVETTNGGAPVLIEGGKLSPIRYELPVASAQVKSAVLLAGLLADGGPTTVVERVPTRDHTERLLREIGVRVARRVPTFASRRRAAARVRGGDRRRLLRGCAVRRRGHAPPPHRSSGSRRQRESVADGLLDVLERMGANIAIFDRRTVSGSRWRISRFARHPSWRRRCGPGRCRR